MSERDSAESLTWRSPDQIPLTTLKPEAIRRDSPPVQTPSLLGLLPPHLLGLQRPRGAAGLVARRAHASHKNDRRGLLLRDLSTDSRHQEVQGVPMYHLRLLFCLASLAAL